MVLFSGTMLLQSQPDWKNVRERGADPSGKVKCTKIIGDIISELSAKGGRNCFFPRGYIPYRSDYNEKQHYPMARSGSNS